MGNYIACVSNPGTRTGIISTSDMNSRNELVKVVLPNGTMEEFQTPMLVAELMVENPLCFVCRSSPSKAVALPADATLELGQLYFLFPSHVLQPRSRTPCHKLNTYVNAFPRAENQIEIKQRNLVNEQPKIVQKENQSLPASGDKAELQMARERYQTRNKLWKPKLETIGEGDRLFIED